MQVPDSHRSVSRPGRGASCQVRSLYMVMPVPWACTKPVGRGDRGRETGTSCARKVYMSHNDNYVNQNLSLARFPGGPRKTPPQIWLLSPDRHGFRPGTRTGAKPHVLTPFTRDFEIRPFGKADPMPHRPVPIPVGPLPPRLSLKW